MITETQYKEACARRDAAEQIINDYGKQQIEDFKARWERFENHGVFFKDEDLVYAAHTRCEKCNAGMAYPKNCGAFHQWTCGNVLTGVGTDNGHTALPFSAYEVLSENQPSARGQTTRPKGTAREDARPTN